MTEASMEALPIKENNTTSPLFFIFELKSAIFGGRRGCLLTVCQQGFWVA